MNPKCATCKFFEKQDGYKGGSCFRFPPTVIGALYESEHTGRETWWDQARPYMQLTDWCGEHVEKNEPVAHYWY